MCPALLQNRDCHRLERTLRPPLSASYCNVDIGNGWRSSVFADRNNNGPSTENQNCTIYGPDGVYANWTAVLLAHGSATVNDWFLIVDEGPATVYADRLTIQNWGWVRSGTTGIINCNANLGCAA
jgi:hypothetical protein